MIVKKIYILVNKMTTIQDSSIFKTLNIGNFRYMFNTNGTVIVNGITCVIISKNAKSACFKIVLRYGDIIFEIHFKFKSNEGSLSSMNMMFLDNTRISDEMTIICHLGAGSFGDVFLVCVAGKEYAMKIGLDIPRGSETISAIRCEMNMFQLLGQHSPHPNLIRSFPIEFPLGPAILLELGQETLDNKIKLGSLTIKESLEIIRQILSAVAFLHSIGISHHDLKPNNIIFVDGVPKLFDFGLSYRWETDKSYRSHHGGTNGYKHKTTGSNYGQDVFSCCFIFIEMLIGKKIRSYNSQTLSGIKELTNSEIEMNLREKQVSEENIKKILQIYSMKAFIELRAVIQLVESIQ